MFVFFSIDLSETDIKEKLANGFIEKKMKWEFASKRIKSDVWKKYRVLFDLSTKKVIANYVICEKCNVLIKYNSVTCSTTTMQRHTANCGKSTPITAYLNNITRNKIKFSDSDIKIVRDAAVKFIAKDLRPFAAIEGEGRELKIICT